MSRTATAGSLPVKRAQRAAAVDRDEEAGLGAEEEQVRVHQVLPHHVGVARQRVGVASGFQVWPKSAVW